MATPDDASVSRRNRRETPTTTIRCANFRGCRAVGRADRNRRSISILESGDTIVLGVHSGGGWALLSIAILSGSS